MPLLDALLTQSWRLLLGNPSVCSYHFLSPFSVLCLFLNCRSSYCRLVCSLRFGVQKYNTEKTTRSKKDQCRWNHTRFKKTTVDTTKGIYKKSGPDLRSWTHPLSDVTGCIAKVSQFEVHVRYFHHHFNLGFTFGQSLGLFWPNSTGWKKTCTRHPVSISIAFFFAKKNRPWIASSIVVDMLILHVYICFISLISD